MNSDCKIFCIGFHKTGLSSLELALKILGYKTVKGVQAYKSQLDIARSVDHLDAGKFDILFSFLENFDVVIDNPWNVLYEELDIQFTNSKFILTIRNEKNWLESAANYFKFRPDHLIRYWIYGKFQVAGNEELFLKRYRRHNKEVVEYFSDKPEKLLVLDIESGNGWPELCRFLDKPILNLPFPHSNKNLIFF